MVWKVQGVGLRTWCRRAVGSYLAQTWRLLNNNYIRSKGLLFFSTIVHKPTTSTRM